MSMTDPFSMSLSDLTSGDAVEVLDLALADVREDPDQPRDDLDTPKAKEALAELAETIKDHGVLQPITVRPRDASGVWMIRFGHRRFRASVLAGRDTIPAIVREDDGTEEDHLYAQVIENEQREGLNALQLANFVKKLMARGQKPAEIARRLGKPKSLVSHLIAIADLPDDLTPVAGDLGPRTLAELLSAHKIDPAATRAFVQENGVGITQVAARAFAQALKAPAAPAPAPVIEDEPAPVTPTAEDTPPTAPETVPEPSPAPSAPTPVDAAPVASVAAPKPSPAPTAPTPKPTAPAPSPAPSGKVVPFAQANDASEAVIDRRTHDALTRLFKIARSDTGQAGRVARFLMACWNANDLGGFDVADLFAVDQAIARDIANVVEFFAEQDTAIYFDAMGFKEEIVAVVELWGAQ